tara:strand:+ start:2687 stop:2890 length:204 start_codon:yes stop_codon:yes gene_type:complete
MRDMNYCRFEDTVTELRDCLEGIENEEFNDLSNKEVDSLKELLTIAQAITEHDHIIKRAIQNHNYEH